MKEDIAGATFMATASSSPELFINTVGTFVTEGDLGVGTIVGSAVFNILAVPACCGLFGKMVQYVFQKFRNNINNNSLNLFHQLNLEINLDYVLILIRIQ